ncbi:MAG: SpoIIE family protein phosphatase [Cytophagales bacterium]|nr:SpoIIE family protein phosphatase [Cytophagales bacterium]MDW8383623.1 SpoIIE family protein phosphatase [Flammeovirgaceae bacterium]
MVIAVVWFESKENRINNLVSTLTQINLDLKDCGKLEKDFFTYETINPQFFEQGTSEFLLKRKIIHQDIFQKLAKLKHLEELEGIEIDQNIDEIVYQLQNFNILFDSLVFLSKKRGFKDYGLEGEMRRCIHQIEKSGYLFNHTTLLTMRRHEKDFMLRKEEQYVQKVLQTASLLRQELSQNKNLSESERIRVNDLLNRYVILFNEIVELERHIGLNINLGLKHSISSLEMDIENKLHEINNKIFNEVEEIGTQIKILLVIVMITGITLNILTAYVILNKLGKPIIELSENIRNIINNHLENEDKLLEITSKDEIGLLASDFNTMLAEIRAQNKEIRHQNAQLQEAYENIKLLSRLGQDITAHLDMTTLIDRVYVSVQSLMPAEYFGIGIIDDTHQQICFKDQILYGERIEKMSFSLNDTKHIALWSIKNREDILIKDASQPHQYFPYKILPIKEKIPLSLIVVPLFSQEEIIGVMTVQSFNSHAYSEYHHGLLKNLATYITIALENANSYFEIQQQRQEIHEKNQNIQMSIHYAQRIQEAILPSLEKIHKTLPESFVFFRPRNFVSGDFYWFNETKEKIFIAAADCTGHGVPGAFMSMMCYEMLNEIIIKNKVYDPARILKLLDKGIVSALKQHETQNKDGMDISLCIIDKLSETKSVEFAGAKHPLYYIQNERLHIIKGDIFPLGGVFPKTSVQKEYKKHLITLHEKTPTTFYLCSDGYQDQFGGPFRKKFMTKRLKQLFLEIYPLSMEEQKAKINDTFIDWKGDCEQTDDILIIGFKINSLQS